MTRIQKIKILEAYFQKAISKDGLEFLLKNGIVFPPIPWIYEDEEESKKEERKRELSCKVFGVSPFPKIKWADLNNE